MQVPQRLVQMYSNLKVEIHVCVVVRYSVLWCVAVSCGVLQCVAVTSAAAVRRARVE